MKNEKTKYFKINIVVNKRLQLSFKYRMTKYLESVIGETNAEKELDKSPAFKNSKDAMRWLNSLK